MGALGKARAVLARAAAQVCLHLCPHCLYLCSHCLLLQYQSSLVCCACCYQWRPASIYAGMPSIHAGAAAKASRGADRPHARAQALLRQEGGGGKGQEEGGEREEGERKEGGSGARVQSKYSFGLGDQDYPGGSASVGRGWRRRRVDWDACLPHCAAQVGSLFLFSSSSFELGFCGVCSAAQSPTHRQTQMLRHTVAGTQTQTQARLGVVVPNGHTPSLSTPAQRELRTVVVHVVTGGC